MKKAFYILSVLIIVLFSGCRGDQQETLIGSWEQISHYEPTGTRVFWQFYAGDALNLYIVDADNQLIGDTIKYTYGIESSTFNIFPGINNEGSISDVRDPSGEYWVEIIKNDEFKATKQLDGNGNNAYSRVELIKR